jgi:1D-myo-inositol-tetrakisphosphate 5-kinase/inositol-polyphosphate multikinase
MNSVCLYSNLIVNLVFSNSDVRFIILDNVANDFVEPCIMDIKIGRQTWDPEATLEKRKNEDVSHHCCPVTGDREL